MTQEELEKIQWKKFDPNDQEVEEIVKKMKEALENLEDAKKVPSELLKMEINI